MDSISERAAVFSFGVILSNSDSMELELEQSLTAFRVESVEASSPILLPLYRTTALSLCSVEPVVSAAGVWPQTDVRSRSSYTPSSPPVG